MVGRTVSQSPSSYAPLLFSPLPPLASSLFVPLLPPAEAGERLLGSQAAVHRALEVFDGLFEAVREVTMK